MEILFASSNLYRDEPRVIYAWRCDLNNDNYSCVIRTKHKRHAKKLPRSKKPL